MREPDWGGDGWEFALGIMVGLNRPDRWLVEPESFHRRGLKQSTSGWVLSKRQPQNQRQPLPNKGKTGRRNHPRQAHRIGVAHKTLDSIVVVIDSMTII